AGSGRGAVYARCGAGGCSQQVAMGARRRDYSLVCRLHVSTPDSPAAPEPVCYLGFLGRRLAWSGLCLKRLPAGVDVGSCLARCRWLYAVCVAAPLWLADGRRGNSATTGASGTAMKVLLSGATGLIGPVLVQRLIEAGHSCYVLSRNPERARRDVPPEAVLLSYDQEWPAVDGVINM